jgi:hypothetical protein
MPTVPGSSRRTAGLEKQIGRFPANTRPSADSNYFSKRVIRGRSRFF